MKKKIILIGGGGHCKACIDVIESESKFEIAGIVDIKEKVGQKVLKYPIIATDNDHIPLLKEYRNFLIAVGQIKSPEKRIRLFEKLLALGGNFPTIISPYAYVSSKASIDIGTIVMPGAIINAGVNIGKNCIINTSAIVEHESIIDDHCHISTGSIINGQSKIGRGSFIGSNATIMQNIQIVSNSIIALGAVVTQNIDIPGIYAGMPARRKYNGSGLYNR